MPAIPAIVMAAGVATQGALGAEAAKAQQNAANEALKKQTELANTQREQTSEAFGGARGAYQNAANQGASALQSGYGQAQQQLGQVSGLAGRFTGGATNAINAYDVTGARSRMGEMMSQGYDFSTDPGYAFRQEQGEEAINRAAAARGGRLSGRTMKELGRFNQGLASQEYQNAFNRAGAVDAQQNALLMNQAGRSDMAGLAAQRNQMGLARMGYGAMGQQAGMSAAMGQQLAGIYGGLGQQLAGTYGQEASMGQQLTGAQMGQQLNPVQYAGGQQAAWGNAVGKGTDLAASFVSQGIDAAGQAGGKMAGGGAG